MALVAARTGAVMRRAAPWCVALLLAGCAARGDVPDGTARPRTDAQQHWRETLAQRAWGSGAAFDSAGKLWKVEAHDGAIEVSVSADHGRTFSTPVRVNPEPESALADGENRPKIAVDRRGRVFVSYTQGLAQPMTGHIRFSRSLDGGRSFSRPVTVNDDPAVISHRFEALAVGDNGDVHLAWLDKRDLAAAQSHQQPYTGAAVYYAVSHDGGETFGPNRKLADHSCECCRVAMALEPDGTPVVVWRHIFDNRLRDHALLRIDSRPVLRRLSRENWAIDACPHHGPALAIASDGVYHAAWYSGGGDTGLFYARSSDRGTRFSIPFAFGDNNAQAGHPALLALGNRVVLAWKEFDGRRSLLRSMASGDGGASWGAATTLAVTDDRSDHPQLIGDGSAIFAAWNTAREGFRLIGTPRP